jgi:hypothetical protein
LLGFIHVGERIVENLDKDDPRVVTLVCSMGFRRADFHRRFIGLGLHRVADSC